MLRLWYVVSLKQNSRLFVWSLSTADRLKLGLLSLTNYETRQRHRPSYWELFTELRPHSDWHENGGERGSKSEVIPVQHSLVQLCSESKTAVKNRVTDILQDEERWVLQRLSYAWLATTLSVRLIRSLDLADTCAGMSDLSSTDLPKSAVSLSLSTKLPWKIIFTDFQRVIKGVFYSLVLCLKPESNTLLFAFSARYIESRSSKRWRTLFRSNDRGWTFSVPFASWGGGGGGGGVYPTPPMLCVCVWGGGV